MHIFKKANKFSLVSWRKQIKYPAILNTLLLNITPVKKSLFYPDLLIYPQEIQKLSWNYV